MVSSYSWVMRTREEEQTQRTFDSSSWKVMAEKCSGLWYSENICIMLANGSLESEGKKEPRRCPCLSPAAQIRTAKMKIQMGAVKYPTQYSDGQILPLNS